MSRYFVGLVLTSALLTGCVNPLYSAADRKNTSDYLRKVVDPAYYLAMDCNEFRQQQQVYSTITDGPELINGRVKRTIDQVATQRDCSTSSTSNQNIATTQLPSVQSISSAVPSSPFASVTPEQWKNEIAKITEENFSGKSCDYLYVALTSGNETARVSTIAEQKVYAQKLITVATAVRQKKACPKTLLTSAKVGMLASDVNPEKTLRLNIPALGVWVSSTAPGGAAEKAGIQARDVIVAVNGSAVNDLFSFLVEIRRATPGSMVQVKVWRGNGFIILPLEIRDSSIVASLLNSLRISLNC